MFFFKNPSKHIEVIFHNLAEKFPPNSINFSDRSPKIIKKLGFLQKKTFSQNFHLKIENTALKTLQKNFRQCSDFF